MGISSELRDDGIRVVTMDLPPVNALTVQGWFDVAAALDEAGRDPATHVVVLRAEGRGFNAGVDIKEMQHTDRLRRPDRRQQGLLRRLQGGLRVRGAGDRRGQRLLPRRRRRPGRQRRLRRRQRRRLLRRARGRPGRARRGHPPGPAGAPAPDAHALLHRAAPSRPPTWCSTARSRGGPPRPSSTTPRCAVAGEIAAKDTRVIRAAKEALNGIDPVDVNKSYRFEQGFTYGAQPRRASATSCATTFAGTEKAGKTVTQGPRDKRMTIDEVVGELEDGMTIGIGGWGPRRKPMALVRAILRSDLKDLTLVSATAAPTSACSCRAGKVRKLVYAFVSLDSVPLEPQLPAGPPGRHDPRGRRARRGHVPDRACAPRRSGCRSCRCAPGSAPTCWSTTRRSGPSPARTTTARSWSPCRRCDLDVALVHLNRADAHGNATYLGPGPVLRRPVLHGRRPRATSPCEQVVDTAGLTVDTPVQRLLLSRMMVDGVVETPNGAHFTTCTPDYERDEKFQRRYAAAAADRRGLGGVRGALPGRRRGRLPGAPCAAFARGGERVMRRDPGRRLRRRHRRRVHATTARSSPARWACCRCSASGSPS